MVKLKKKRPMSYKFTGKIARAYDQEEEDVVIPDYVDSLVGQYGSTWAPTTQDVIDQNFNAAFNNNGGGFFERAQDTLNPESTYRHGEGYNGEPRTGNRVSLGPIYGDREDPLAEPRRDDPPGDATHVEMGVKINF